MGQSTWGPIQTSQVLFIMVGSLHNLWGLRDICFQIKNLGWRTTSIPREWSSPKVLLLLRGHVILYIDHHSFLFLFIFIQCYWFSFFYVFVFTFSCLYISPWFQSWALFPLVSTIDSLLVWFQFWSIIPSLIFPWVGFFHFNVVCFLILGFSSVQYEGYCPYYWVVAWKYWIPTIPFTILDVLGNFVLKSS